VWVHGGGFVSGRRGDIANYLKILAGQGFAVVNVDYTIAPEATYPAPVRQLGRALAFIDSHAATLGINARALILAGDSAGAQIAAQMANIITNPAYAHAIGVTAPVTSQRLRGALLYCGVYDLQTLGTDRGGIIGWFLRTVTWAYSGSRDWSTVPGFERMSVARHVGASFPPAFISAGNADPLGPQSVAMARALQTRQVQVETLFFPKNHKPDLGHEYQFDLDHADGQTALARSVTWLRRHGLQD
jgi:acetyl esterase/lipase